MVIYDLSGSVIFFCIIAQRVGVLGKMLLNIKCVFCLSLKFLHETFLMIRRTERETTISVPTYDYEGVTKSPRTMLITRKSLVVHEFPARVCCGGVL